MALTLIAIVIVVVIVIVMMCSMFCYCCLRSLVFTIMFMGRDWCERGLGCGSAGCTCFGVGVLSGFGVKLLVMGLTEFSLLVSLSTHPLCKNNRPILFIVCAP